MKKQHILITYVNKNDIPSISKRERIFKDTIKRFTDRGLSLIEVTKDSKSQTATFNNGSAIIMMSFGVSSVGMRFTHLFVDEEVFAVPNGEKYVSELIFPQLMRDSEGSTSTYDLSEPADERIKFFKVENNKNIHYKNFKST
jgi:hypothetical protein